MRSETDVSRRRFLALGGAAVAAGAVAPWIDPLEALGATSWPQAKQIWPVRSPRVLTRATP